MSYLGPLLLVTGPLHFLVVHNGTRCAYLGQQPTGASVRWGIRIPCLRSAIERLPGAGGTWRNFLEVSIGRNSALLICCELGEIAVFVHRCLRFKGIR